MTNWNDPTAWNTLPTWGGTVGAPPAPPPAPVDTSTPGHGVTTYELPGVSWTVDGTPVRMGDWSATSTWEGGYDQMRGVIPVEDLYKLQVQTQGATVKAFTDDGTVRWEGRLSAPPHITDDRAYLSASGPSVKAAKKTDRLFIQSVDIDIWSNTDSEPFLQSNGDAVYPDNGHIGASLAGGAFRIKLEKTEPIVAGRGNGIIAYVEGVDLKRVAWFGHWETEDNDPDFGIRVYRANGPLGVETALTTVDFANANRNQNQDITVATAQDAILLIGYTINAINPNHVQNYAIRKLRVNSEVTTADTFTGSDIMDHIGTTLGWDTFGVVNTTDNALPFDWTEDWASAASYVATNDDYYWRVLDGGRLEYAPWGTCTWDLYLTSGISADITPGEIINRVIVPYETPHGVLRRAVAVPADIGVADPLISAGITNTFEYELADRQFDGNQATRVAKALLRRVIRDTYFGTIDITAAFLNGGNDPYGILPGDVVRIADWGPGQALSLRVMETEITEGGMQVSVERSVNIESVTAYRDFHRHRKRKKGRK